MKICFDVSLLERLGSRSGIFFVLLNIFKELQKRAVDLYLYIEKKQDIDAISMISDSFPENKVLYMGCDFSDIDVFLSPCYKIPDFIHAYPNISRYTILHDCIPYLLPQYFGGIDQWFGKLANSFQDDDFYFSNSEYTKTDFLKYWPQIDEKNITTSLIAANFLYKPNKDKDVLEAAKEKYKIPLDKKFIFSCCSLDPRKNLLRCIRTFIQFIDKNKIDDLVYVISGKDVMRDAEKWAGKIPDFYKYQDKIIKAGYVADEDLEILYSNAQWFVYTSQYEGFGMPPLEAMSCGCPVITSNNSSLPEVVGDAGQMIDWDSDEQHIAAYERYYMDEKYRKAMAKKGLERSKLFSWKKTVDVILDKIREIEKRKSNKPLVSVITATYNLIKGGRKETFEQNVDSVKRQTYKNIEHIVIDGASNDGTIDLLKKYQKKGEIEYYSEPDKGIYDAMNKGISKARGKYVICLNSDDFYCDEHAIEYLVEKAEEQNADAVYGDAVRVHPQTLQEIRKWKGRDHFQPWHNVWPCHQTFLIKTDVMKDLGLYDLKYKVSADNAFFMRMLQHDKKFVGIDYEIIHFRDGGFSNDHEDIAKQDQIGAFFEEYGQYHGLTRFDSENLFANNYLSLSPDKAIALGAKLPKAEWRQMYFEKLIKNNFNRVANNVHSLVPDNARVLKIKKYKLFDFIPLLKSKTRWNVTRYLLFGFLPVLKKKTQNDIVKLYLFAFLPLGVFSDSSCKLLGLPIVSKKAIKHNNYNQILPGMYNFSDKLPIEFTGVCAPESWGAWSSGNESSFFMKTNDKYIAEFDVNPFLANEKNKQVVSIYVNNRKKDVLVFEAGKPNTKIAIDLPKSEKLHIMFKYTDVKSPKDLRLSDDARKIAIGFKTLKIQKRNTYV